MSRRFENRAAALAVFLCGLFAAGCEAKITEVVVLVESDLRVPEDIDTISVRVNTPGRNIPGLDAPLSGSTRNSLPLTLGLRSESDAATPFTVVVRGLLRGTERIRAEVSTRFVPGERRLLHIRLTTECLGVTCAEGETTCRYGECREVFVDPQLLPPFAGFDLGVDAQVVDGGPVDGGPSDASDDAEPPDSGGPCTAGDGGVVGAPPGCVPARPNVRPVCADDGSTVGSRYFALRDVIVDQGADLWRTLGWDLDGDCTDALSPMPVSECTPPGSGAPTDGLNGIDNAFGAEIVPQFLTYVPEFLTSPEGGIENGKNVPIVTLENWNGRADDPRVLVALAYTIDMVPAGTPIPDGGVTPDNSFPVPVWDGRDVAYVSSSAFTSGGRSILFDDNAYVAGGMIVARLPDRADLDLPAASGTVRARLTDFRFTAQLSAAGDALTTIRLTGRWPEADLLSYLDDVGICPGTPANDAFRVGFQLLLSRTMDVRATPGTGGPGVNCDAVSTVFPFQNGVQVTWGGIIPLELAPFGCP